jgi:cytosolic 5'-nucleotidase 3
MISELFSSYDLSSVASDKIAFLERERLDAVVADFDRTITESDSATSVSIFRDLIRMDRRELVAPLAEDYLAESDALFAKYHPIEFDALRPLPERIAACEEWWAAQFELMARHGIGESVFSRIFADAASRDLLRPRPGMLGLMRETLRTTAPFVVFSAGLGNTIEACLESHGLPIGCIGLVSNTLEFESDGRFRGRLAGSRMIHTFSKDERHAAGIERISLSERSRIVLFGDNPGDADMAEDRLGRTVLRVGICDSADGAIRERYRGAFDLVLSPREVDGFCQAVVACLLPFTRKTED